MKVLLILAILVLACAVLYACGVLPKKQSDKPAPGSGGEVYVPLAQRSGDESVVYFTRDLSPDGLIKAYEQVCAKISGHVGVKLHTGEQNGPNIIPRDCVKELFKKDLPEATII